MGNLAQHDLAPDFNLPDQEGKLFKLSDYRGYKVLLFFYPKAGTSGCTKQVESVRDAQATLKARGVVAVGISPDSTTTLKKFALAKAVTYPLLSDADHTVAMNYGAWGVKSLYGKKYEGVIRSAFLVDEAGHITGALYKISPQDTVPRIMACLPG